MQACRELAQIGERAIELPRDLAEPGVVIRPEARGLEDEAEVR